MTAFEPRLEAVVVEDVGEILGDDAADAEIEQCPGGMLAARAAAEVRAGDQDLGVLVGRLVEDEILLLAVGRPAHFVEQTVLEAGALDGLQELLGNDHVGVDIDHGQRCCHAAQRGEFFHEIPRERPELTVFPGPGQARKASLSNRA